MDKKREHKVIYITKKDAQDIIRARAAIGRIYEKTRKYPSTLSMLSRVQSRIDVLTAWYQAHVHQSIHRGMDNFPYNVKEWRGVLSDAKSIYTFSAKRGDQRAEDKNWSVVLPALELAIDRARYVAGQ